jgi:hypothetical protein
MVGEWALDSERLTAAYLAECSESQKVAVMAAMTGDDLAALSAALKGDQAVER